MLYLDKPETLEQATTQRDALAETLHAVGVESGVLDPNVACDGPVLLMTMGSYVDHLKGEDESHPVLVGALRQAYASVESDFSTGSRKDPLYRLLEGILRGGEDDPVNVSIQLESLQRAIGDIQAAANETLRPAPSPGAV